MQWLSILVLGLQKCTLFATFSMRKLSQLLQTILSMTTIINSTTRLFLQLKHLLSCRQVNVPKGWEIFFTTILVVVQLASKLMVSLLRSWMDSCKFKLPKQLWSRAECWTFMIDEQAWTQQHFIQEQQILASLFMFRHYLSFTFNIYLDKEVFVEFFLWCLVTARRLKEELLSYARDFTLLWFGWKTFIQDVLSVHWIQLFLSTLLEICPMQTSFLRCFLETTRPILLTMDNKIK
jgi:hypothetical protein